METVAAAEFLLRENDWEFGDGALLEITPWSEEISRHFDDEVSNGSNRRQLLKLGGLLHDVAKPMTKTIDDTGRMRFLGHTKQGAIMASVILNRLRFSNREVKLVETLVYHHLHPVQMSNTGLPSNRAIYRYFRDTGTAGIDVIFLALADYLAVHGPDIDIKEWKSQNQLMEYILAEHARQKAETLPVKLIDGCDIMSNLGLKPGPVVGELLTLVREAQAAGEVCNRDQAMALVRREVKKKHCGTAC